MPRVAKEGQTLGIVALLTKGIPNNEAVSFEFLVDGKPFKSVAGNLAQDPGVSTSKSAAAAAGSTPAAAPAQAAPATSGGKAKKR